MTRPSSFYWYDYETFGADPRRDRPAQFAGLRTDADLNPIGEPLTLYCQPAPDFLPVPEACLITGITPQEARRRGVPEAEFIAAIHEQFSEPGTCVVGYNNVRFDDEVTRHALYRNFFDAYAYSWRNGNSRWDLIDPLRLARALRPEGIEWPKDDTGRPSMKLELLTAANGIDHVGAHDALVDVRATLAMARLLKDKQPKLFQFLFDNRGKRQAADLLALGAMQPVVHASEKFSGDKHCIAVVVALAGHPTNPNGVVTYDLSDDPSDLLSLDPDALRARLFTPVAQLPAGVARLNLKTVHLNKCPVLAPMKVLRLQDAERLGLDLRGCERHLEALRHAPDLAKKVHAILATPSPSEGGAAEPDPDTMLYDGGFFSDQDKRLMDRLRTMSPAELARATLAFEDARLPEMLFRYRARNYPETLNADERARWETFRLRRINEPAGGGGIARADYKNSLRALESQPDLPPRHREIIAELWAYLREIAP
jgi:exodeoxyribonuclease-1